MYEKIKEDRNIFGFAATAAYLRDARVLELSGKMTKEENDVLLKVGPGNQAFVDLEGHIHEGVIIEVYASSGCPEEDEEDRLRAHELELSKKLKFKFHNLHDELGMKLELYTDKDVLVATWEQHIWSATVPENKRWVVPHKVEFSTICGE